MIDGMMMMMMAMKMMMMVMVIRVMPCAASRYLHRPSKDRRFQRAAIRQSWLARQNRVSWNLVCPHRPYRVASKLARQVQRHCSTVHREDPGARARRLSSQCLSVGIGRRECGEPPDHFP